MNGPTWSIALAGLLAVSAAAAQDQPAAPAPQDAPAAQAPQDAPVAQEAPAAPAAPEDATTRPLIERSIVLVPEKVGDFVLTTFEDYPGQPAMGVGTRYEHPDYPEVVFNVFIYPFGDAWRDTALDQMVGYMQSELRKVEASGSYEQLEFGTVTDIDLQRVDVDGRLLPVRDGLLGRTGALSLDLEAAKRDFDAALVAETARVEDFMSAATDPDIGRRLPIRFRYDGEGRQSVSFLFQRQLYAFKARLSSTLDLDPDTFDRFTNLAIAAVVPAIEIRSVGRCANQEIVIGSSTDENAMALEIAAKATAAQIRQERSGCHATLDETVPPGMRGLVIDVADIWESSDDDGDG